MVEKRYSLHLAVNGIIREINVFQGDLTTSPERYDLVMCSAFKHTYYPKEGTLIGGLNRIGISVEQLSKHPAYGAPNIGFWISKEIKSNLCKRICCVELVDLHKMTDEESYSGIFDVLATSIGVDKEFHFKRIATTSLGTGLAGLSKATITPLMLNMMLNCFRRNDELLEFAIYGFSKENADMFAKALSVLINKPFDVFVSYPHEKEELATKIVSELANRGLKVWFDYHSLIGGDEFDVKITEAIDKSKLFLFLWFEETEQSEYCEKELRQAKELGKIIIPYHDTKYDCQNNRIKESLKRFNYLDKDKFTIADLCNDVLKQLHEINRRKDIDIVE